MDEQTYRQKYADVQALKAEADRISSAGETAENREGLQAVRARIAEISLELANEQFR